MPRSTGVVGAPAAVQRGLQVGGRQHDLAELGADRRPVGSEPLGRRRARAPWPRARRGSRGRGRGRNGAGWRPRRSLPGAASAVSVRARSRRCRRLIESVATPTCSPCRRGGRSCAHHVEIVADQMLGLARRRAAAGQHHAEAREHEEPRQRQDRVRLARGHRRRPAQQPRLVSGLPEERHLVVGRAAQRGGRAASRPAPWCGRSTSPMPARISRTGARASTARSNSAARGQAAASVLLWPALLSDAVPVT